MHAPPPLSSIFHNAPSAAFKDTPSQLSMKTLCIETRLWGSNMKNSAVPPPRSSLFHCL